MTATVTTTERGRLPREAASRLAWLPIAIWLCGCSGQAVQPVAAEFDKPQRIISLSLGNDEILCSLVDPARIAALSPYAVREDLSHVAEIARQVAVTVDRDPEQIIALEPDLILAARYTKIALRELVSQTGAAVSVTTAYSSFEDIENNIASIGRAVGEPERAAALIEEMSRRIHDRGALPDSQRAGWRVLYYTPSRWTAGSNTTIDEVIRLAGFRNAAADAGIRGHQRISEEILLEVDPDAIVIERGYARDEGFQKRLLSDPQLAPLSAVQGRRIAELPPKLVVAVSHYLAEAVPALIAAVNSLP